MAEEEESAWVERYRNFEDTSNYSAYDKMRVLQTAGSSDHGIVGASGKGSVFVRDNGVIDIFAKEGLGIRIDPDLDSIAIFADKFNVYSSEFNMYTNPLSLKWNKFPLVLQQELLGQAGPFPCVSDPGNGTIMPYNTAMQDAWSYATKVMGSIKGGG